MERQKNLKSSTLQNQNKLQKQCRHLFGSYKGFHLHFVFFGVKICSFQFISDRQIAVRW